MYFLSSISGSWKIISLDNDIIRHLLLCRALSKSSRVGLRNVYLAALEYFLLGIMHFGRLIRIEHFTPAPGLLIDSPGYEVA